MLRQAAAAPLTKALEGKTEPEKREHLAEAQRKKKDGEALNPAEKRHVAVKSGAQAVRRAALSSPLHAKRGEWARSALPAPRAALAHRLCCCCSPQPFSQAGLAVVGRVGALFCSGYKCLHMTQLFDNHGRCDGRGGIYSAIHTKEEKEKNTGPLDQARAGAPVPLPRSRPSRLLLPICGPLLRSLPRAQPPPTCGAVLRLLTRVWPVSSSRP